MNGNICPYCRYDILDAEETDTCPVCGAAHHFECWGENGGCAVIGCEGVATAPAQSKIVITATELDAPAARPPAQRSEFSMPQIGRVMAISAALLVVLAVAAAFFLRSATRQEEGPAIDWGDSPTRQVR